MTVRRRSYPKNQTQPQRRRPITFAVSLVSASIAAGSSLGLGVRDATPVVAESRRISESQYRHTIAEVFGPEIVVNAHFEPSPRLDGLLAVGAARASVSAAGFQQYFSAARGVSQQIFDAKHRARVVTCVPVNPKAADDRCASTFLLKYGRLLYRRPLTATELASELRLARENSVRAGDFYIGLQMATIGLMTSPDFIFRIERGYPGASADVSLDAYSRASRISFLLWDAPPDGDLLTAAEDGSLLSESGLRVQVKRMAASRKVEDGVRAFFADLLQTELLDTIGKDAIQYPKFSQAVAASAREQTLKVLVDHLAVKRGDYRDIFTSRDSFINRPLASIYQVPFVSDQEWSRYTFDQQSGQSGILTQAAFLSMFAHPGRSSPTKRGVAISDIFLCMQVPPPPANVDLSAVNDNKSSAKTVREGAVRLTATSLR